MKKLIIAASLLFSTITSAAQVGPAIDLQVPKDGFYSCDVAVFRVIGQNIKIESLNKDEGLVDYRAGVVHMDYSWINEKVKLHVEQYTDSKDHYLLGFPNNHTRILVEYNEVAKANTFTLRNINVNKDYYFHNCKKAK